MQDKAELVLLHAGGLSQREIVKNSNADPRVQHFSTPCIFCHHQFDTLPESSCKPQPLLLPTYPVRYILSPNV